LQLGPWLIGEEKPRCAGKIPTTAVTGGEGELAGWIRELGQSLLGVMGRSGLAGGGGTAVNRGGGGGAQPRQRCSSVMAHQRGIRGGGKAPGE
jgi:hypothetical protein